MVSTFAADPLQHLFIYGDQDPCTGLLRRSRQFQGFSPHTVRRYRTAIDLFIKQTGIAEIEAVNASAVRDWFFRGRAERGWSVASFHTYHKSLKVFFRWCRKRDWMKEDVLADLVLPKAERRLPPKLTREQAFRLLEVTDNYPWSDSFVRFRNLGIMATFLFAGLRKSELLHLEYANLDLAELTLFVRCGKGKK